MKALALILAFLTPVPLIAGGWGSGGGTLLGDQINPWFISNKNDKKVSYCLEVDKINFSETDEEVLEEYIQRSFKYWHDQLLGRNKESVRIKVNPRMFVKDEKCIESTELRFQFGVLSPEQRAKLIEMGIDFKRQVGVSVRTDYDRKTLQGRGFIYIGDDKDGDGKDGDDHFEFEGQIKEPWSYDDRPGGKGIRLQGVLIHELGHVFGLRHFGPSYTLMNELFPQLAVMDTIPFFIGSIFYPKTNHLMGICGGHDDIYAFLGISGDDNTCLRFTLDLMNEEDKIGRLEISYDDGPVIATAYFDRQEQRYEELVNVYLPPEQEIFDYNGSWPFASGPKAVEWQFSGILTTPSNLERPIFLQAGAGYFQLGGVLDGRMIPDLFGYIGPKRWEPINIDR